MSELPERPGRWKGWGCGCLASAAFFGVVGLPLLFVFSFGMSPCEDGPCNPNGARDFNTVAAIVLVLAVALGVLVRILVRRRKRPD